MRRCGEKRGSRERGEDKSTSREMKREKKTGREQKKPRDEERGGIDTSKQGGGEYWENNGMQEKVSYAFYRRRGRSRTREECMKKK